MGTLAALTVKPFRLSPLNFELLLYSLVMVCWCTTIYGASNIFQFGFIGEASGTTRCILATKHTTYGTTYTPREPPVASREAATPNIDSSRISSRFIA